MTPQGEALPIILMCGLPTAGLTLSLLIYAIFGKQLRRRKRAQIRRLLDSED